MRAGAALYWTGSGLTRILQIERSTFTRHNRSNAKYSNSYKEELL
jgi:predicted nucleic-acid-binding Zn-ribbon protein